MDCSLTCLTWGLSITTLETTRRPSRTTTRACNWQGLGRRVQAVSLNAIGSVYNNTGDYQAALTYFQQAYEIRDRLKLPEATESLRNWAEMNFKLGQYDTAQSLFLKALNASRSAGDKEDVALASSTMGVLFAAQGKYDAALSSLQDAVNIFQQLNDQTWYSAETLSPVWRRLVRCGPRRRRPEVH